MRKQMMLCLNVAVTLTVFLPVVGASYLWQAAQVGWAYGEWAYDPDAFEKRYGKAVRP